jgi:3-methyl-2-oxobutanoate hydroxymethyltransferase
MSERKKMTAKKILKMKGKQNIVMITAYDYPTAKIVDEAGVDAILVGDSLGMVVLGYETTHHVTMEDMIRHTQAVARAKPKSLIISDMPFGSYEPSTQAAVDNAIRLARAGAEAVKLEGGEEYADRIKAIVRAGIPVMGHIGLTPQRYLRFGGYKLRGKSDQEAAQLLRDAEALVEDGVFAIVIEFTREEIAKRITERVNVPTICIGSGRYCDGQVLVFHDLLGLTDSPPPFAKQYANLREIIRSAVERYATEVSTNTQVATRPSGSQTRP